MFSKISVTLLVLSLGLATNAFFWKGLSDQGKHNGPTTNAGSPSIVENGGTKTQVTTRVLPSGQKVTYKYTVVTSKEQPTLNNNEKIIDKVSLADQTYSEGSDQQGTNSISNKEIGSNSISSVSGDWLKQIVDLHNLYRSKHGAPPLAINNELNALAQDWAKTLGKSTTLRHRRSKYGENIYWSSDRNAEGKNAPKDWYGEIAKYRFNNPGYSGSTVHFTQLVWKSTKEIGCGRSSGVNGLYIVCNYSPRGNVVNPGYFEANVLPPN